MDEDTQRGIGGFAQGFASTFFPAQRANVAAYRQQQRDEQARALQDFQMRQMQEQATRQQQGREALAMLNTGQLAGMRSMTPRERTGRAGFDPFQYVTPQQVNYETPEQQRAAQLGLYGQKRAIDLATTPQEHSPLVKEFIDVYGRPPKDAREVLEYNLEKKRKPESEAKPLQIKNERDLRKEFSSESDYFKKIKNSYQTIRSVSREDSAAGDIGLVFSIMKMFDPGSVVRESEFATAQNAAGVPERIRAQFNRILSGQRLTPAQRKDFVGTAERIYEDQATAFQAKKSHYDDLARAYGMDPGRITYDFGKTISVQPTKPIKKPKGVDLIYNPETGEIE